MTDIRHMRDFGVQAVFEQSPIRAVRRGRWLYYSRCGMLLPGYLLANHESSVSCDACVLLKLANDSIQHKS